MKPIWAVGLMTGTVLDGNVDVALLKTDGERIEEFGAFSFVLYPETTNTLLQDTLEQARAWNFTGPEPEIFARAEEEISRAQSAAVRQVVEEAGLTLAEIGVVGFHGQTVLHEAATPDRHGKTRQLGDGALMAGLLGVDVVFDFRSADVAAGGQGAPLSPVYHRALLQKAGAGPETAVLNLGGVGNLTWVGPEGELIAFDTGPANAPINDFVKSRGLGAMDRGGALAQAGTVDEARLEAQLRHPYLARAYPKSLDRFDFGHDWVADMTDADGAATLTAFTAAAVGMGLDLLPERPTRLVVCGGGRHNPALLAALGARTGTEVLPAEAMGWRGDAVEAECFAMLAVRVLRGLPISFPTTTGAPVPMAGGRLAPRP